MGKKICVIGGGRWGQNHIRTLFQIGNLAGIVETNQQRLEELLEPYPVKGFTELDDAIQQGFDGYILATPAETHYPVGKKLLEKGLNVLIEKPMALSSEHSRHLVELAGQTGARLMVGHLLLFHPAIKKIKEVIKSGKIGRLYYIYSTRLNLGTVRTEENVFWSFAPHDISILDYFIGRPATKIEAKGAKFLQDKIYDVTIAQFTYPGNVHAHIFVSWLHPFKEQRLVVVGSQGMVSFDDSSLDKNILYYNKHIDWVEGKPVKVEQPDEIIVYDKAMPLTEELKYFVNNLDQKIEFASGKTGHEVVKVLETVQELISKNE
ncbi:4-carboxy-2-hydroxymuconate-6-semialdehyde dehydrogenase [Pelotomaculum schinkii]|uniref:4-carboxy-2-hydroxymuconate-6-semialdehyde dehydrogenase n=1 Tax=Pelotomaculum schinkii TaxID=78350 RepID=A0A4Y7RGR2_9FIRM|nr:Gfo/Idh/MocA family oxidoreductase [Pelotomaculum schinkii]TEB08205.1 4-carboxy-2-hydroxymuconate-6-semialdehyde dehydrogenase [Pelotomaculum schinkii]